MQANTGLAGISIVTTTWNEKENIPELIRQIRETLKQTLHEIIVVDDDSQDGTFEVAKRFADVAVKKKREGQTKGLLYGMKLAKYPLIVTIDSDLENKPDLIPTLIKHTDEFDVVSASRLKIPRFSEKIASKTLGKLVGVTDSFSNYRVFKKEIVPKLNLKGGETFGGEFMVIAKKNHLKIKDVQYLPPSRRENPRIGGAVRANLRIFWATIKCLVIFLF